MVSAFAETNRLPFDLPESETELVAGYNTEYSSMKFALFFMGEYAAIIAGCGLMVTLFFWWLVVAVDRGQARGDHRHGNFPYPDLFDQDIAVAGDLYLGALDVPAFQVRSIDEPRLEAIHSCRAGQHFDCGHHPDVDAPQRLKAPGRS